MSHLSQVIARRSTVIAILVVLGAVALGGCTTPAPPKPAMVPLGQTGDFGYSARDLDSNRVEVTYTGAAVKVPTSATRNDPSMQAELAKTRDLALWHAAQIADERGMMALKIEKEASDTDVQVTRQLVARPAPFTGFGYYGRPWWFSDYPYYYQPIRRAAGRVTTTLTVQLFKTRDVNDATQLPVPETLSRLTKERTGAVY